MSAVPYATRLRIHLVESRRRGLPFEDAWRAAKRAHPAPADPYPWPMDYAKRAFRDGYLRLTAGTSVGALAEREYARPSNVDPDEAEPAKRRCGWGGSRCEKAGAPYLCPEHAATIAAVPRMCAFRGCYRDSVTRERYCPKHEHMQAANQRGAEARSARATA